MIQDLACCSYLIHIVHEHFRNVSMSLGHLPLAFSVEPRLSES